MVYQYRHGVFEVTSSLTLRLLSNKGFRIESIITSENFRCASQSVNTCKFEAITENRKRIRESARMMILYIKEEKQTRKLLFKNTFLLNSTLPIKKTCFCSTVFYSIECEYEGWCSTCVHRGLWSKNLKVSSHLVKDRSSLQRWHENFPQIFKCTSPIQTLALWFLGAWQF